MAWVQSLVRELRSHKLRSIAKKKKKILMYKEWLFMEFSYLSHFVVGGGGHDEFLVGKGHSLSCGLDFSGSWWEVLLEDSTGRGT